MFTKYLERIGKGKLFPLWLISYISMFVLPIILHAIVFGVSISIIDKETNYVNNLYLLQSKQFIDQKLSEVNNISKQFMFDSQINGLLFIDKITPNGWYQAYEIRNRLSRYKQANSAVSDIFVYFKQSALVITNSTTVDVKSAQKQNYRIESKFFKNVFDITEPVSGFYLVGDSTLVGGKITSIAHFQGLPVYEWKTPSALLVVVIDISYIERYLNEKLKDQYGDIIINHGSVSYSTKKSSATFRNDSTPGGRLSVIDGVKYLSYEVKSDVSDFSYELMIPQKSSNLNSSVMVFWYISSVMICILIGVFMAVVFARANYNPVKRLLSLLNVDKNSGNEYSLIEASAMTTISQRDMAQSMVHSQRQILQKSLFANLLQGDLFDDDVFEDLINTYGIEFKWDNYFLCFIYLKSFSSPMLVIEDKNIEKEEIINATFSTINTYFDQQISEYYKNIGFRIHNMLVYICSDKDRNEPILTGDNSIDSIFHIGKLYIKEAHSIEIFTMTTQRYNSMSQLRAAYKDSLKTLDNNRLSIMNQLPSGNIIKNDSPHFSSYIDHLTFYENQICNLISSADYEKIIEIIDNIFSRIDILTPIDLLRFKFIGMVYTMVNCANEQALVFVLDDISIARLLTSNSVQEYHQIILDTVKNLHHLNSTMGIHDQDIIRQIMNIVKAEYANTNLNVSYIADRIGVSVSHLSRSFKSSTGTMMHDYIHSIRITAAKALLLEKRFSIKYIAMKVGYYEPRAFIRAFQHYEGLTPGKYKNST